MRGQRQARVDGKSATDKSSKRADKATTKELRQREAQKNKYDTSPIIRCSRGQVDPPLAQYEPFRRTYVSDPACVPQLRFANVSDAGADHHKRETSYHWRRGGRTWPRVPRFRKGMYVFVRE